MPELTEAELKKEIERSPLNSLYFLYGEEKYLISFYAEKLRKKVVGDHPLDFNLQRFSGDNCSVDQFAAAVEALPVMAQRKCVAVSDLNVETMPPRELSKLYELLESIPESTVLVIFQPSLTFDAKKSAAWKKFLAAVKRSGICVLMKQRENAELERMLCACAEKRSCSLSRQNAARIVSLCGRDLQTLLREMEKLCAYTGEGEISREAIGAVVVPNMETTVFLLSKAPYTTLFRSAYGLLDQLFRQREEPVAVLAVLASAYVDMYRVRAAVQSGMSAMEPAKHFSYRGREFRLKNAERDGKRLSTQMLRQSLDLLLETDLCLKGSRTDDRILLEELIAKLLMIAEKERMN